MRWNFIVFFICISLKDGNTEHSFMSMTYILFLLWKISINIICPFLNWIACFVVEYLDILLHSGYHSFIRGIVCNVFSHFVDCLFTLLIASFAVQKILILIQHILFFFLILLWLFLRDCQKYCTLCLNLECSLMFYTKCLAVSGFIFRYLFHFELIGRNNRF